MRESKFDFCINVTMLGIALWAVTEAGRIIIQIKEVFGG